MEESAFWRDLEDQFSSEAKGAHDFRATFQDREVTREPLRAARRAGSITLDEVLRLDLKERVETLGKLGIGFALAGGPKNDRDRAVLHARFRALAERAALGADLVPVGVNSEQAVEIWVVAIYSSWGPFGEFFDIHNLCEASALMCRQLATIAYRQRKTPGHGVLSPEEPTRSHDTGRQGTRGANKAVPKRFPKRADWLGEQLADRGWTVHDFSSNNGPDRKTSRKVLEGKPVVSATLERIALGLSSQGKRVRLRDIPND